MIGGLDFVIITAVKAVIAPIVDLSGSTFVGLSLLFSPVVLGFSAYLDTKIKKRGGKS